MKPWDAMTDREKDAAVADIVMGWLIIDAKDGIGAWDKSGLSCFKEIPAYTTDRNAFAEVEAAMERRKLRYRYLHALAYLIDPENKEREDDIGMWLITTVTPDLLWRLHTAPLDIRCKAALAACGVEVG